MSADPSTSESSDSPHYDERLSVPAWALAAALVLAVVFAAQVHGGRDGLVRAVLPYVLLPAAAAGGLLGLSRGRLQVSDGLLTVPGARLPLKAVGRVAVLDRDGMRRLRGPDGDPAAYVVSRPWIGGGVWVELDDPSDSTPWWLLSSRHPAALAAALDRTRTAEAGETEAG